MAILVRFVRSRRRAARALLVLAVVSASGCLVLDHIGWSWGGLAFSHATHVLGEELECIDCHMDYEESDQPGMPVEDDCLLCHDPEDPELPPVPMDRFYAEGEILAARVGALPDEVVFSHQAHVTDEEGCLDCHAAVAGGERIQSWMAMDMDGCVDCHDEAGLADDCASCHAEIRLDASPWTHDGIWGKHHGLSVRDRSDLTVDRCDLCHEESTCDSCHQENPPESHNSFWRRRAHGLTASMDRQSCAACHRQDYCDRCHREALPMTHRGPWGGSRNTHCYGCHLTEADQSCFLCHDGTPSHAMAPPQPPGHDPASDCRSCHVILTHVDKGDDCNLCHH